MSAASPYSLHWPGLADIPAYIIDPATKALYSADSPLPQSKLNLECMEHKYVRLSTILDLFSENMREETQWILTSLEMKFSVEKLLQLKATNTKLAIESDSSVVTDKSYLNLVDTTYVPAVTLLALVVVWPCCRRFQTTRKAIVDYLDNYDESVCNDCGYIHRDCRCDATKDDHHGSPVSYVGYGVSVADKSCQADIPNPVTNTPASLSSVTTNCGITSTNMKVSTITVASSSSSLGQNAFTAMYQPSFSHGQMMPDMNPGGAYSILRMPVGSQGTMMPPPTSVYPMRRGRPGSIQSPYNMQQNFTLVSPFGDNSPNVYRPGQPRPTTPNFGLQYQQQPPLSLPFLNDPNKHLLPAEVNYFKPILLPSASAAAAPGSTSVVYRISDTGEVVTKGDANRKRKFNNINASGNAQNAGSSGNGAQSAKRSRSGEFGDNAMERNSKMKGDSFNSSPTSQRRQSMEGKDQSMDARAFDFDNDDQFSTSSNGLMIDLSGKDGDKDGNGYKKSIKLWKQLDDSDDDEAIITKKSEPDVAVTPIAPQTADAVDQLAALPVHEPGILTTSGSKDANLLPSMSIESAPTKNVPPNSAEDEKMSCDSKPSAVESSDYERPAGDDGKAANGESEKDMDIDSNEHSESRDELEVKQTSSNQDTTTKEKVMAHSYLPSVPSTDVKTEGANNSTALTNTETVARIVIEGSSSAETAGATENAIEENQEEDIPVKVYKLTPTGFVQDASTEQLLKPLTEKSESNDGLVMLSNGIDSVPKQRKLYGKFEYLPTGEHIYRCIVTKCSQCFDDRHAAELHNTAHIEIDNPAVSHLKCPSCNFKTPFYHWFNLLRHMCESHDIMLSRLAHSCKYCGLNFENEEELVSHIDYHYSNRYKCIHCGLLLLTWEQVKKHLEICTDKHRSSVNLGCPFCTFVFHKKTIRNIHLLSHRDTGLVCALCEDGSVWDDWKDLRKHYQQKHAKIMQSRISPFRDALPIKRKPPACSVCSVEYKTYDQYNAHMIRTHFLLPYILVECALCLRQFKSEKSHDWHVRHAHGEEIPCEKCDYVATSKANLKLHVAENHAEKQHTCTECEKSFQFYTQLRVHMAHHARHTIYSCSQCDMEFTRQADLRSHTQAEHRAVATDKGASDHCCPECDYRCYSRLTLKLHVSEYHPELLASNLPPPPEPTPEPTHRLSEPRENNNFSGSEDGSDYDPESDNADEDFEDVPTLKNKDPSFAARLVSGGFGSSGRSRYTGSKRGRKPKKYYGSESWAKRHNRDNYSEIEDRRERRRQKRLQKELEDRLRKLKKVSCARTRTFFEHQAMRKAAATRKAMRSGSDRRSLHDEVDRKLPISIGPGMAVLPAGAKDQPPPGILGKYPYIDHAYCLTDEIIEPGLAFANSGFERVIAHSDDRGSTMVPTPDVSAFQECETVLLGLRRGVAGGPIPGQLGTGTAIRRPGDPLQRFSSVFETMAGIGSPAQAALKPRLTTLVGGPYDAPLDTLRDLESDLLRSSGGGEYNLLQDILGNYTANDVALGSGVGGIARGGSRPGLTATRPASSDYGILDVGSAPFRSPPPISRRAFGAKALHNVSGGSDCLSDSPPLASSQENGLATDLDDIELCEADYSLWEGLSASEAVDVTTTTSSYLSNQSTRPPIVIGRAVSGSVAPARFDSPTSLRGAVLSIGRSYEGTATDRVNEAVPTIAGSVIGSIGSLSSGAVRQSGVRQRGGHAGFNAAVPSMGRTVDMSSPNALRMQQYRHIPISPSSRLLQPTSGAIAAAQPVTTRMGYRSPANVMLPGEAYAKLTTTSGAGSGGNFLSSSAGCLEDVSNTSTDPTDIPIILSTPARALNPLTRAASNIPVSVLQMSDRAGLNDDLADGLQMSPTSGHLGILSLVAAGELIEGTAAVDDTKSNTTDSANESIDGSPLGCGNIAGTLVQRRLEDESLNNIEVDDDLNENR